MNYLGKVVPSGSINIEEIINSFDKDDDIGAITTFTGIVRQISDKSDKTVVALEVEAWEERANDTMQEIAKKILNNHNLINIGIVHLTGYLNIGDPIVYIVIKSIHRKEAFVALEEAILAYKQGSPVWKKEIYADGSSNWITTASKV